MAFDICYNNNYNNIDIIKRSCVLLKCAQFLRTPFLYDTLEGKLTVFSLVHENETPRYWFNTAKFRFYALKKVWSVLLQGCLYIYVYENIAQNSYNIDAFATRFRLNILYMSELIPYCCLL